MNLRHTPTFSATIPPACPATAALPVVLELQHMLAAAALNTCQAARDLPETDRLVPGSDRLVGRWSLSGRVFRPFRGLELSVETAGPVIPDAVEAVSPLRFGGGRVGGENVAGEVPVCGGVGVEIEELAGAVEVEAFIDGSFLAAIEKNGGGQA